jgi:hypothetical protein
MTIYAQGSAIAAAFDPDTGGAESFSIIRATDAQGNVYAACHAGCSDIFPNTCTALMMDANALKAAVDADYAARFSNLTPPTLADCQAFILGAKIVPDCGLVAGLASIGMTRTIPQQ